MKHLAKSRLSNASWLIQNNNYFLISTYSDLPILTLIRGINELSLV